MAGRVCVCDRTQWKSPTQRNTSRTSTMVRGNVPLLSFCAIRLVLALLDGLRLSSGFCAHLMFGAAVDASFAEEVGNFYYGSGHPMKPHRIRMAHTLVLNYGLYKKMEIFVSLYPCVLDCLRPATVLCLVSDVPALTCTTGFLSHTSCCSMIGCAHASCCLQRPHLTPASEMTMFHADDYVHFLQHVNPDNVNEYAREVSRCESCEFPVFLITVMCSLPSLSQRHVCSFCLFSSHTCAASLLADNADVDCPVFDGLFRFCQLYTGGSVGEKSEYAAFAFPPFFSHCVFLLLSARFPL